MGSNFFNFITMENIIMRGGKLFLQTEIKVNCEKPDVAILAVDVDDLIKAVEQRIKACNDALLEAYKKERVYEITHVSVLYLGGQYNKPSIDAMESALKILRNMRDQGIEMISSKDFKSFDIQQLNQMKKAVVNFYNGWNDVASLIEYHELMKLSSRQ